MISVNQPKYIQVMEHMKEYIINGELKEHDRMLSENIMKSRFNVSRHTVRKAISNLILEGWLYAEQGKGTFVSNKKERLYANANNKSNIIGVITTYVNDYIFPDIIEGIDNVLHQKGYSILLGSTQNQIEKERQCLKKLLTNNVSALIVEPTKSALPNPNTDIYKELKKKGIPIIFIHGSITNVDSSFIVEDDDRAGYIATKHLIDLGHKKIAGIFKSDDIQGHKRYQGYLRAHREKNISIKENIILWYSTEDEDTLFSICKLNDRVIDRVSSATGIVCYNDQIAVSVKKLLEKQGKKIPEDISIVSFDNSRIGELADLTTMDHPKSLLGEMVAKSVLKMIKNKDYKIEQVVKTELQIRKSTKRRGAMS